MQQLEGSEKDGAISRSHSPLRQLNTIFFFLNKTGSDITDVLGVENSDCGMSCGSAEADRGSME